VELTTLHFHVPTVWKSDSFNFLEPSWTVQGWLYLCLLLAYREVVLPHPYQLILSQLYYY